MNLDERNRRTKAYVQFRMMFDLCMGAFYILGGAFVIFSRGFQTKFNLSPSVYYSLGGILLVYGGYRMYRGLKHIF